MRRFTAGAFVAVPLLLQIPYVLLATRFDYPQILREPAGVILTRYGAAGPELAATWYLYAMTILPLLVAIGCLPTVEKTPRQEMLQVATGLGMASALLQMIGLLRWVFLVPSLAKAYGAPGADRAAIELVFQAQHQLLGAMVGEHLGQLLLALWTMGVSIAVKERAPWNARVGTLAGGLFLAGLVVDGVVPGIAFGVWSVWCCWLGLVIGAKTAGPS